MADLHAVRSEVRTRLATAKRPEAALETDLVLAHLLNIPRLEMGFAGSRELSTAENAQLQHSLQRLESGEPVQYVIGQVDFYGMKIAVDRRALIPRPETEGLVEAVVGDLQKMNSPRVVEVGTGTGCIALALAQRGAQVLAVDISEDALALAAENASRLHSKVEFRHSDLLSAVGGEFDMVVSNPPYVAESEWEQLPPHIREFEPRLALVGGKRGSELPDRLLGEAFHRVRPGGIVWLEMGAHQSEAMTASAHRAGFTDVSIHVDLAGMPRYVRALKS